MKRLRPIWAVKVILVILVTSIFFRCVSAANYTVGGPTGWDLASDMRTWSTTNTFYIDDALVFRYEPIYDVIEVNQPDFAVCKISNPIRTHTDGFDVIPLTQPGSRYFVCGRLNHCNLGLKLEVLVLAQLNNGTDDDNDDNTTNPTRRRSPRTPSPSPPRPPSPSPPRRSPSPFPPNSPEGPAPSQSNNCHNSSASIDTKANWMLEYPGWLSMFTVLVILAMIPVQV